MSDTSAPATDDRIDLHGTDAAEPAAAAVDATLTRSSGTSRLAAWTFAVYVVVAFGLLMWLGRYHWFFGDEWSFLSNRSTSVDGLFRPHNQQHWVTLPVLVYRGLYSLVGLRHYWPYLGLVVVLHLAVAVLLRLIMRRAGVHPWIATITAGLFVLLGPAEDNILWAFQITFVGSLFAGLVQIILSDHEGLIDRRDWFGLGAGLLALMTSGQGPSLVAGAGLVCLLRRRWSAAVLHTVPLAAIYLIWVWSEDVSLRYRVEGKPFTLAIYVDWMKEAALGLFSGLGHFTVLAICLVALLLAGWLVAWRAEGATVLVRRAAVPLSLMAVAFVTMSSAAPSRAFLGIEQARAGRYIGVMAALVLPALAVAADAIARLWPRLLLPVCALLLLPIPFNATEFNQNALLTRGFYDSQKAFTTSLAYDPLASQVPSWVMPNVNIAGQPDMTVGWLLQAARDGALPDTRPLPANAARALRLQLGVASTGDDAGEDLTCEVYDEAIELEPEVGDRWWFASIAEVALRDGDTVVTPWRLRDNDVVEITLPDLQVSARPPGGQGTFELCR